MAPNAAPEAMQKRAPAAGRDSAGGGSRRAATADLMRELAARQTIAAVADALQFTPSAVSQQLAILEREAGVPLLERAGRGVRLTDPALMLVEHAEALLERAALAEADLAAAAGAVTGRARIAAFESVALH